MSTTLPRPVGQPSSLTPGEPFSWRGRDYLRFALLHPAGARASFAIARRLGDRYEVEELLAEGETSVLLRARDSRTFRPVVIKALRGDILRAVPPGSPTTPMMADEVRRLRHLLQTERRLLVRLRNAGCNGVAHPNDYVYDANPMLAEVGIDDEFLNETEPYLVLQQLTGVGLDELLAAEYPSGMDERQALGWLLPVVKVLEVLHEPWTLKTGRTWHCVYQDLKPENLVVDPLGRLTLLDFGGCQVVVDGTPVLEGACTPGYCPPECLERSVRVLLPCADVYTIGSTLFHMLTGIDPRE